MVSSGDHRLESHSLDTQNHLMQEQGPTVSRRAQLPLSPAVLPTRHLEVLVPPHQPACPPGPVSGVCRKPTLRRALCLVSCCAVTILKFFLIFF